LVDKPPEADNWIHEIKYDGYRTERIIEYGAARAFTSGRRMTPRWKSIQSQRTVRPG
jgi:ATP-dependent DNA ligase